MPSRAPGLEKMEGTQDHQHHLGVRTDQAWDNRTRQEGLRRGSDLSQASWQTAVFIQEEIPSWADGSEATLRSGEKVS